MNRRPGLAIGIIFKLKVSSESSPVIVKKENSVGFKNQVIFSHTLDYLSFPTFCQIMSSLGMPEKAFQSLKLISVKSRCLNSFPERRSSLSS